MMVMRRVSAITGIEHVREIPITEMEYFKWRLFGPTLQEAIPHLSDEDADFILSGINPDEWKMIMKGKSVETA